MSFYASFQGRVYLGKRNLQGNPVDVRSPGNVAELKLALKTEVLEHFETQSGQRSLDHRMIKTKSATVSLTIEEFTQDNLALALYGKPVTHAEGIVNSESIGGLLPKIGERYFFSHPKISNLVFTDSAALPAELDEGTNYTADTDFGAAQFLDVAGFTPPFKASYSFGEVASVGIFTQPLPERFLRLEGINTAQGNAPVLVELYRVAFDPLKELALISNEYNKFELEGSLLADATKSLDSDLGQYGRIVQIR